MVPSYLVLGTAIGTCVHARPIKEAGGSSGRFILDRAQVPPLPKAYRVGAA